MAEIGSRQNNPGPGIDYSEIHIPNDQNLGTGTYMTVLQPNALARTSPVISMVVNVPVFQISVNINPVTKEIPILLGRADNTPPISRKVFRLPENIELSDAYRFEVVFADWEIKELTINGVRLQRQTQPGTVSFSVDPTKNLGALTEGVNYRWGVFKVNDEECTVLSEGKMLSAIMNQGTDREVMIFSKEINANPESCHMIAVTWSSEELNLYFDGKCLYTLKMADFFH